jgi:hypothetical protein
VNRRVDITMILRHWDKLPPSYPLSDICGKGLPAITYALLQRCMGFPDGVQEFGNPRFLCVRTG